MREHLSKYYSVLADAHQEEDGEKERERETQSGSLEVFVFKGESSRNEGRLPVAPLGHRNPPGMRAVT